jgi:hypothetical protein
VERLLSNVSLRSFASRDEQEVAGYAEVMEAVLAHWQAITLTENHIKQLHRDRKRRGGDIWRRGAWLCC